MIELTEERELPLTLNRFLLTSKSSSKDKYDVRSTEKTSVDKEMKNIV